MNNENLYCEDCLKDDKVICKRDPDVKCLICGANLCGGHIAEHLKTHCIALDLKYCSLDKELAKDVFIFPNGMVAVCDKNGKQMPEYQDFLLEVASKLPEVCDENTRFYMNGVDADFVWWFQKQKNELKQIISEGE